MIQKVLLLVDTIIMRSRQVFRLKIDFDTLIMPNQSEERLRGLTCTRICYVRQCVFVVVVVVVRESDSFSLVGQLHPSVVFMLSSK